MKKGTITFNGSPDSLHTYQLALDTYKSVFADSTCNGITTVVVLRNWNGDDQKQDQVPSGWFFANVFNNSSLCIDGGSEWYVYPTKEAWDELFEMV